MERTSSTGKGMARTARTDVAAEAGCACGAVTVRVSGKVKSMLLCTCTDCQRATGAGHSAAAMFAAEDVGVEGETKSFTRPADSGATLTSWFCPSCGTPLKSQSSRAPGVTMVPAGLFGAQGNWYRPERVIFARSHLQWDRLDPSLPTSATYPERPAR